MLEDKIADLLKCNIVTPITPVSGGFLHRMYRVDTDKGTFAVKHLNPNIMARPGVKDNYRRAEELETMLEEAGIPIVPALTVNGRKMQEADEDFFYIFNWQNGSITDWNNITEEQCRIAGNIQGKIHAIEATHTKTEPELSHIDWDSLIEAAENTTIETIITDNKELLIYAENELNKARNALPDIETIVNEDMDPKNVMWDNNEPVVIDLECLDRGNPVSSAIQLSLQWSGITTCDLDLTKTKAFFDGYRKAYDNGFRDYASVFGLTYTWIEWLEYNIRRALGDSIDKAEQEMGIQQVEETVARIRYIRGKEEEIKQSLNDWFR